MSVWESLILGLIQGLTEFLPVSSSGHLEIGKVLFGSDFHKQESLLFTITLHVATALSTSVVFRKEIARLFIDLFKFKKNEATLFTFKIVLSMIPAVAVGLFLEDFITSLFDGNILLVGTMLWITAIILFCADRVQTTSNELSFGKAALIGVAQAIAILPGISRSGATIGMAVLLKIDRSKAARFSFLMVLPLIFGSMVKSLLSIEISMGTQEELLPLFVGFLAAFVTGIVACRWMIALVRKSQLKYFAFYCMAVGGLTLLYEFF